MDSENANGAPAQSQRPRLNLKPRDPAAARAIDLDRARSGQNIFGAAKPREEVLAERTGKAPEDIVKEQARQDKLKLRLTPEQLAEKKAAEDAVTEIEEQLTAEQDDIKKDALQTELASRQKSLGELLDKFEELAIEQAKEGKGPRPSERRVAAAPADETGFGRGYGPGRTSAFGEYRGSGRGGRSGRGGFGRSNEYGRPEYVEAEPAFDNGASNYRGGGAFGGGRQRREYGGGGRGQYEGGRGYDNNEAGSFERSGSYGASYKSDYAAGGAMGSNFGEGYQAGRGGRGRGRGRRGDSQGAYRDEFSYNDGGFGSNFTREVDYHSPYQDRY